MSYPKHSDPQGSTVLIRPMTKLLTFCPFLWEMSMKVHSLSLSDDSINGVIPDVVHDTLAMGN